MKIAHLIIVNVASRHVRPWFAHSSFDAIGAHRCWRPGLGGSKRHAVGENAAADARARYRSSREREALDAEFDSLAALRQGRERPARRRPRAWWELRRALGGHLEFSCGSQFAGVLRIWRKAG
ncbi:hypothetical protein CHU98_g3910 [Xylaria longipes]|nr:hypothetical protein CHU98_g3910 [Xylaria longipes]